MVNIQEIATNKEIYQDRVNWNQFPLFFIVLFLMVSFCVCVCVWKPNFNLVALQIKSILSTTGEPLVKLHLHFYFILEIIQCSLHFKNWLEILFPNPIWVYSFIILLHSISFFFKLKIIRKIKKQINNPVSYVRWIHQHDNIPMTYCWCSICKIFAFKEFRSSQTIETFYTSDRGTCC